MDRKSKGDKLEVEDDMKLKTAVVQSDVIELVSSQVSIVTRDTPFSSLSVCGERYVLTEAKKFVNMVEGLEQLNNFNWVLFHLLCTQFKRGKIKSA